MPLLMVDGFTSLLNVILMVLFRGISVPLFPGYVETTLKEELNLRIAPLFVPELLLAATRK